MDELVSSLDMEQIIEFHACCDKLMEHQITDAGNDWLLVLNRDIGLETIFRWATFVGKTIGEDFRNTQFKQKARKLSVLIQERFSEIGLDISLWSPVFFYLGMIYTFSKHIGFVKIKHNHSDTRIEALTRFDPEFANLIRAEVDQNYLFIDSRKQDPINITNHLIEMALVEISSIEIFVSSIANLPDSFSKVNKVKIHHFEEMNTKSFNMDNIEFIGYWQNL